jgi:hypothetical protein
MAFKFKKDSNVKDSKKLKAGEGLKKVRSCKLCKDTGLLRIWQLDANGKRFYVDEVCACANLR